MGSGRVLLPPDIVELSGRLIFLAGPIQGAKDWQAEATRILHDTNPAYVIANPRRVYLDGEFIYEAQVDWETHYLRRAGEWGVILFWLAKENEHDCERAFGQTSRFELAEWKERHRSGGAKLAVGIEEGFTNARYIKRRFAQDCPDVAIQPTLEATCREAVRLLRS